MKSNLKISLLAATTAAALTTSASATVIYDETFESYALGDSNGQGLWVDFGGTRLANVVDTRASTGAQSLELSTNPGYGSDTTIDLPAPISAGQLTLSFDIYQPTGFDGIAHIFLSRGPTLTGTFDEGFHLLGNGTTGTFVDTPAATSPSTPLLLDQWVSVLVNIDLDANTATASYGGVEIFNGAWNNGGTAPGNDFQGVNIWAAEGLNVAVFNIDNFRLESSSIPEPSGVALLGLGVIGLAFRRRRA